MSFHVFAYLGRRSLEPFVDQFHFWLSADAKTTLIVLRGANLRPTNFVITCYLSDRIAWATGSIVNRLCGREKDKTAGIEEEVRLVATALNQTRQFDRANTGRSPR